MFTPHWATYYQDIVCQCLVGPGVVKGCGQVNVSVQNNQERAVEAELGHGHVVSWEEAVPRVSKVLSDLLVQLFCHHLCRVVLRTANDGDSTWREENEQEKSYETIANGGVLHSAPTNVLHHKNSFEYLKTYHRYACIPIENLVIGEMG